MITSNRRRLLQAGAALIASRFIPAQAQTGNWPSRPIKCIVPYTPGGGSDIAGRLVTAAMSNQPGGPQFVIDNRPGAGGNIGCEVLAQSPPDGYNIGVITIATHGVNPTLYPNLPYDPIKDFSPIALVNLQPVVVAVRADSPIKNLADLLSRKGEELTFGSAGNGLSGHMAGELMKLRSGLKLLHVPYRGSSGAWTDLLGGRIDMVFDNIAVALPNAQAGKARILGTSSRQPVAAAKAPTIGSLVPDYVVDSWNALAGPAKMPPAIVQRLSELFDGAIRQPTLRARYEELSMIPPDSTSPEFAATYIQSQIAMWAPVIKEAGIKVD